MTKRAENIHTNEECIRKKALQITDIAEMIYLAGGVLTMVRFSVTDKNGVMLHGDDMIKQLENDRNDQTKEPIEQLLHSVPERAAHGRDNG